MDDACVVRDMTLLVHVVRHLDCILALLCFGSCTQRKWVGIKIQFAQFYL